MGSLGDERVHGLEGATGQRESAHDPFRCHFTKTGEIVWVFEHLSQQATHP